MTIYLFFILLGETMQRPNNRFIICNENYIQRNVEKEKKWKYI